MAKTKFDKSGSPSTGSPSTGAGDGHSTGSPSAGSGGGSGPVRLNKRTLARVKHDQELAWLFGTMWATAMGEVLMGPEYGWSEEAAAALVKTVIAKANSYVKAKGGAGG